MVGINLLVILIDTANAICYICSFFLPCEHDIISIFLMLNIV